MEGCCYFTSRARLTLSIRGDGLVAGLSERRREERSAADGGWM